MSIKVKILEFEQLNYIPEDESTIDRHHSLLSTYWLVEINHNKCIFLYMDVNFFDAEYTSPNEPLPISLWIWCEKEHMYSNTT